MPIETIAPNASRPAGRPPVPAAPEPAAPDPAAPAEARWHALGTSVHLLVIDPASLPFARRAVERVLADVDATYSRFRPDSELSLLNVSGGREVPVSSLMARAIGTALRAARLTGGAVDPTIGRTLRLLGYDRDFDLLGDHRTTGAGATAPLTFASIAGWEAVEFDAVSRRVRLPRGVELDLGATGKGLAADLAAEAALTALFGEIGPGEIGPGETGVLVSLGGDIATAGMAPDGGWRILRSEDHATPAGSDGEVIRISDGALATSSTTLRRWTRDGVERHHLLDPVTGLPAAGLWRTATVAATTCADANAAATASIVMGESAPAWLTSNNLPACLVAHDGSVVRVAGWPSPRESSSDE